MATNDKIIRIKADINSAIADAQRLKAAYAGIGNGAAPALNTTTSALTGTSAAARALSGNLTAANTNTRAAAQAVSGLGAAAQGTQNQLAATAAAARQTGAAAQSASGSMNNLGGSLTGVGAKLAALTAGFLTFGAAAAIGGVADAWSDMQSRIGAATKDMDAAPAVMSEMVRLANLSYSPLEQTAEAFGRNVSIMRELGYSTQSTIDYTEALNHALVITATRGEKAASVQDALGKAMATGKMDSDGVQQILANGGRIAEALAQQLGTTSAGLLKMAADGKITASVISTALIGSLEALRAEAAEMPATMADGMTRISNNFQQLIGEIDQTTGASAALAELMLNFADNIGNVAKVVGLAAVALVAYKVAALAVVGANAAAALGFGGMAAAAMGATRSVAALTLAMLTNPAVLLAAAITGLVAVTYHLVTSSHDAEASILASARALKELGAELNEAERAALVAAGENDGLSGSMAGSENVAWSYKNAVDNLTKSQWELAKASRAARLEQLQKDIAVTQKRGDAAREIVQPTTFIGRLRNTYDKDGRQKAEEAWSSATNTQIAQNKELLRLQNTPLGQSDLTKPLPAAPSGDSTTRTRGGGGRSSGRSAADEAAELAKRQKEYWDALRDSLTTAGLLRHEQELHSKTLELQKILKRDITAEEATQLTNGLAAINNAKALTALKQTAHDAQIDLRLEGERQLGLSESQQEVEDRLFDMRRTALQTGVDIGAQEYLAAEAVTKERLEQLGLLKEGNRIRKEGFEAEKAFLEGTSFAPSGRDRDRLDRDKGFEKAKSEITHGSNGLSEEQRAARLTKLDAARAEKERVVQAEILNEKLLAWSDAIHDLADLFGGRLGGVLGDFANAMSDIAGTMQGEGPLGGIAKQLGLGDEFKAGAGKVFGDLKGMFGDTFKNLGPKLGEAMGKAQAGMQIGGMVNSGLSALGIKTSKTGAQIGGAIGSFIPIPGMSIVGSVVGGVLGGLLKKAKWGTAVLGDGDPTISGRGAAHKAAAEGAAGSVMEGLNQLAIELGGSVGNFKTSIGQYKDNWRVSTTGHSGKLNFKGNTSASGKGLHDFGSDAASAIKFAIEDAISDGAITGLAPLIQKALSTLTTDAAIQFARDWKSTMDGYSAMLDPVGAAAREVIEPFRVLRETMVKVGAGVEDLTKLDDYRTLRLKSALKEQLASLTDFISALKGEGSGITQLNRLNSKMVEFEDYRTRIAAGDSSIDQSAFTALGQEIFGLAGSIYGTATSQFQNIRNDLLDATSGFADNVTDTFNSAATVTSIDHTTTAIQAQTSQQAAQAKAAAEQSAIQTAFLKKIAEAAEISAQFAGNGTGGKKNVVVNGVYTGKSY